MLMQKLLNLPAVALAENRVMEVAYLRVACLYIQLQ